MSSFFTSSLDKMVRWSKSGSLGYLHVTGGCCADEVLATESCKYDLERFGALPQAYPERSDLLIVSTAITRAMVPELLKAYQKMPSPKYVMALGSCACSGGPFSPKYSYASAGPLADTLPVDVYVSGCPPRPEAIMNGPIR